MSTTETDKEHLLLEAFDVFTKASSSLEEAYRQLQKRSEDLSLELEATNRKLKENLEEKERVKDYLNNILESLPCGVLTIDLNGRITICNRQAAELLCLSQDHLNRNYLTLLTGHPVGAHIEECLRQAALGMPNDECRVSNADSFIRHSSDLEIGIEPGGRTFAVTSSIVQSRWGETVGLTFIIRDVSHIKQLEEQTKRSERLSAMGEMAVELAHEIRNPLAGIELFASLLKNELQPGGDAGTWAEHIQVGVRSLNNIVSNMLHFTRDIAPAVHPTDIHVLIDETLGFAGPVIMQRGIKLVKSYCTGCPSVQGDKELLKQVFLNLIFNALQAMPDQGLLEISTQCPEPDARAAASMEIRVRDTGVGIAADQLERIFDPFFTTSKTGTGLGLAVVSRIVQTHRGTIRVESQVGKGTTFIILLPQRSAFSNQLSASDQAVGTGEKIF